MREILYCELVRVSRQVVAATVRLRLSEEESRMDLTIDLAVTRLSDETEMADWRSCRVVVFGGSFEREDWHCCGKRVALQACWISGTAVGEREGVVVGVG